MGGIIGYGAYIPRNRVKVEEIAKIWGADAVSFKRGLGLEEKAVAGPDQDVTTMSVEAARKAIRRSGIDPKAIGSVYIGSESHPYSVKATGTAVVEAVGGTQETHSASLEFACKAGSEAMFICLCEVEAGRIQYGLAIGADTAQGAPGDALEYSAAAGAAAFVFGKEKPIAEVIETNSFMTDTPDFWRREFMRYPRHAGRFTGEPGYFRHTIEAAKDIMAKAKMMPKDFTWAVFHQPNGKFPLNAAKKLGFTKEQIEVGRIVPYLGNTYSGACMIGLTAILDVAKPGDKILMVSYGSGAGSDGFIFAVTDRILEVQDKATKTRKMLDSNKCYLDYGTYAKYRDKILKAE